MVDIQSTPSALPNSGTGGEVLSEEEAALYDRQIRLWGLEAQRQLHSARVLIIGVNGLGAEVTKNVVLAGVHSCTLADDVTVSREHMGTNFLLPRTALGRNRAEAAVDRSQALNPRVKVTSLSSLPTPSEITSSEYSVVVVCLEASRPSAYSDMLALSSACHTAGVQFFTGQVFGYHGFAFVDLQNHEFVVEEKQLPSTDSDKPSEATITVVKKQMNFATLDTVLANKTHSKDSPTTRKRLKLLYLMQVLHKFVSEQGHAPGAEDVDKLLDLWITFAQDMQLDPELLTSTDLELSCLPSLPAVNAIMGGLVAQEVIKAISHKETPLGNFIFFDGGASCAIVDLYIPNMENNST